MVGVMTTRRADLMRYNAGIQRARNAYNTETPTPPRKRAKRICDMCGTKHHSIYTVCLRCRQQHRDA